MAQYIIRSRGDRRVTLEAKNAQEAKRKACKHWGYKASDPWVGVSGLKATRVKEDDR